MPIVPVPRSLVRRVVLPLWAGALFVGAVLGGAVFTGAALAWQDRGLIEQGGTSARIEQVKRDFAGDGAAAIDKFWTSLSREHAPIVQAVPGDPAKVLVTLVWRGDSGTRAVHVAGMDMLPIAGTDVTSSCTGAACSATGSCI